MQCRLPADWALCRILEVWPQINFKMVGNANNCSFKISSGAWTLISFGMFIEKLAIWIFNSALVVLSRQSYRIWWMDHFSFSSLCSFVLCRYLPAVSLCLCHRSSPWPCLTLYSFNVSSNQAHWKDGLCPVAVEGRIKITCHITLSMCKPSPHKYCWFVTADLRSLWTILQVYFSLLSQQVIRSNLWPKLLQKHLCLLV